MPRPPAPPGFTRSRPSFSPDYGISASEEGLLTWSAVADRLVLARNYWISTTRPDGRPHAAPVWGLWLENTFYFSTDPTSRKARNLLASPEIVVHLESGDDVVILEGTAERVDGASLPATFADAYDAKYGFRLDLGNSMFGFYRLHVRSIHAWEEKDFLNTATRWTRDGVL